MREITTNERLNNASGLAKTVLNSKILANDLYSVKKALRRTFPSLERMQKMSLQCTYLPPFLGQPIFRAYPHY